MQDTEARCVKWSIESNDSAAAPAILKLLLDAGLSASATDYDKMTPLHIAAYRGHKECLQTLLGFRPPLENHNRYSHTPLAAAQLWENYDLAVELLDNGASPNHGVREKQQETFFTAVMLGREKAVEALMKAGVDVQTTNENNQNALQVAKAEHRTKVVEILKRALRSENAGLERGHQGEGRRVI